MDAAEDPDPDGWPVHPAVAFYGLWPRFAGMDDADGEDLPQAAAAAE